MDKNGILKRAIERFNQATDYYYDSYKQGLFDLRFVSGNQWDEEVKQQREKYKRPTLTVNKLRARIRTVIGDLRQAQPEVIVKPVDNKGDEEVAKIYEGIIRYIQTNSKAKDVYLRACEQAISCGVGHFRIVNDYIDDESFEQELKIESISNPFSVYWDTLSQETDFSDARYCFIISYMEREEFERVYKDKIPANTTYTDLIDDEWVYDDRVRIVEYFWKEPVKKKLAMVVDPNGNGEPEVFELRDGITEEDLLANGFQILKTRVVDSYRIMYAKFTGFDFLEEPEEWVGRYIPVVTVVGDEIFVGEKRVLRSIVRDAIDSQKLYNYWKSSVAEYVNLVPKVPYLVTPKMIEGFEPYWQNAHVEAYPYLPYNPDPKAGAPTRLSIPSVPREMFTELITSNEDIKDTTGIYDAYVGAKSNETSGKAIQLRMAQTSLSVAPFFDNLRRAIEYCGRVLVDLIPKIYDTERYVRITNPEGAEELVPINKAVVDPDTGEVKIMNDLSAGRYDIVVEAGQSFSTRKEQSLSQLTELARVYPDIVPFIIDLMVDNMDLPKKEVIKERLSKHLPTLQQEVLNDARREQIE